MDWTTPQDLYDQLDKEFHFTIDVAATPQNTKCKDFYTIDQDALAQEWNGVAWCNPPYGRNVGKWVEKAANSKAVVIMLLFAKTDTIWFHKYIYNKAEIRFIRGRLKFGGCKTPAPFPSMIVIFRNDK